MISIAICTMIYEYIYKEQYLIKGISSPLQQKVSHSLYSSIISHSNNIFSYTLFGLETPAKIDKE